MENSPNIFLFKKVEIKNSRDGFQNANKLIYLKILFKFLRNKENQFFQICILSIIIKA